MTEKNQVAEEKENWAIITLYANYPGFNSREEAKKEIEKRSEYFKGAVVRILSPEN